VRRNIVIAGLVSTGQAKVLRQIPFCGFPIPETRSPWKFRWWRSRAAGRFAPPARRGFGWG